MTETTTTETPLAMEFERFALAGDATFTLRSCRTGQRFTYRIDTDRSQAARPSFVWVLTGPDNTADFGFLGAIFPNGPTGRTYHHGRRSRISPAAPCAQAFEFAWAHRHHLAGLVEVFHAGRCCRCGRMLTTPESVAAGIGPECAKREE
jgi:hypothetical protein